MVQGKNRSRWRGIAKKFPQRVHLGPADDAMGGTRDQAVQGNYAQAIGHAGCGSLGVQAGQELADVRAAGIEVPGTKCGRESRTPVVVAGRVHVRDSSVCRELPDSVANQRAALGRSVISDIAGDHDQVKARQMTAVPENLVERTQRVNTILVEAARGDMGIGQVQDPVRH
jgi:hypothetical protein